jgi:hypothetical protein
MSSNAATNITVATCYHPADLAQGPDSGIAHVRIDFRLDATLVEGYLNDPTRGTIVPMKIADRTHEWYMAAEQVRWLGQVQVLYINIPAELQYFRSALEFRVANIMMRFWMLEGARRRLRVVIEEPGMLWGVQKGKECLKVIVESVGFECSI